MHPAIQTSDTNNVIFTITTKGCKGCSILNKLITEALGLTSKKVEYVTKDVSEVEKYWLRQNNVDDFPTTFLMRGNNIKFKFTGTRPAIVIARWIDVNF